MKQKLIVVTGAAGMIGSGVVRWLNEKGISNLLLVDDLKQNEKWKNLVGKEFVDLISRHCFFDWLEKNEKQVEAIVHLGACSDTLQTNGDYLLENNYRYSIRLIDWALRHKKRLVYASSASTYGDGKKGFADDEEKIHELVPLNLYAFSKQLIDLWVKRNRAFDRVVGLKYFNVFGPNEYHKGKMASMVFKMSRKVEEEGVIQLYKSNDPRFADGDQCRDFIYVKDAVKITCSFLEGKGLEASGLFNVGQGEATTWNRLAKALFQAMGKKVNIEYIDMPVDLARQYQNYTCAETGKMERMIPLKLTSIEEAVNDYATYLKADARW